jgi:hypothetical protein
VTQQARINLPSFSLEKLACDAEWLRRAVDPRCSSNCPAQDNACSESVLFVNTDGLAIEESRSGEAIFNRDESSMAVRVRMSPADPDVATACPCFDWPRAAAVRHMRGVAVSRPAEASFAGSCALP